MRIAQLVIMCESGLLRVPGGTEIHEKTRRGETEPGEVREARLDGDVQGQHEYKIQCCEQVGGMSALQSP